MELNSKYDNKAPAGGVAGAADRALDILEFLERHDESQSLTQIVEGLGLPKASVFRLLTTLRARGYVAQGHRRGAFSLGLRVVPLAARARERTDLLATAQPFLRRLAEATGESCQLSVRSGAQALCAARVAAPAQPDILLAGQVGSLFPLHAAAVGKVLLAFAPAEEQAAYLARDIPAFTPNTRASADALMAELTGICRQGYALDQEEYRRGLCALAAPVFEHDGSVPAAIALPFLAGATAESLAEKTAALRATADDISRALGYAGRSTEYYPIAKEQSQ
jgi:DNA-binding IclR family transcriptional regulator